jgi:hypothetical protein
LRYLRAALMGVLGLFVSGWVDTAVTLVILAALLVVIRKAPDAHLGFVLAGALALQLLVITYRAARPPRA